MKFKKIVALMLTAIATFTTAMAVGCGGDNSAESRGRAVTSSTTEEAKEYYISNFLPVDAQVKEGRVFLDSDPTVKGGLGFHGQVLVGFNNENFCAVKNIFGEVKLNPFDMDEDMGNGIKSSYYFWGSLISATVPCVFRMMYGENGHIGISIDDRHKDIFDANVYVYYSNGESSLYLSGLISEDTEEQLVELLTNIYVDLHS